MVRQLGKHTIRMMNTKKKIKEMITMIGITINSIAENKEELADMLRIIADQLDQGYVAGYDPTFEITGEVEPETLEVEDIKKFAGATIRVCGRIYTLTFEDAMSGELAVWESERFGGGKKAYLIYATPNFDLISVPVDIRIGEFDETGLITEHEIQYVKDGEKYYGQAGSDDKVTSFDEYKNMVIELASEIITEFEDAEEKELI
jgi:hypothetical protein